MPSLDFVTDLAEQLKKQGFVYMITAFTENDPQATIFFDAPSDSAKNNLIELLNTAQKILIEDLKPQKLIEKKPRKKKNK